MQKDRIVKIVSAVELAANKVANQPKYELPLKDCKKCIYSKIDSGGHCFMFLDEPLGIRCGQFRAD
jgi:hypothetical protein